MPIKSWPEALTEIEVELQRCSQRLPSGELIPDEILLRLPKTRFEVWAPVLDQLAEEIGKELLEWATKQGAQWYSPEGPRLEIRLSDRPGDEIITSFSRVPGSS